jgi:hypothetical protein
MACWHRPSGARSAAPETRRGLEGGGTLLFARLGRAGGRNQGRAGGGATAKGRGRAGGALGAGRTRAPCLRARRMAGRSRCRSLEIAEGRGRQPEPVFLARWAQRAGAGTRGVDPHRVAEGVGKKAGRLLELSARRREPVAQVRGLGQVSASATAAAAIGLSVAFESRSYAGPSPGLGSGRSRTRAREEASPTREGAQDAEPPSDGGRASSRPSWPTRR